VADYSSIGEKFGIIYTCNCGWLDRAHSYPAATKRTWVGLDTLWNNISLERGTDETLHRQPAYVIGYRQDAVKKLPFGGKIYPGVTNRYVVLRGLSNIQKQQVALAIFIEVSLAFETTQASALARFFTGTDSGFSEEDLVSDLIGFYKAVNPKLDADALCKPVSVEASRRVWNANGPVGKNKNRSFTPIYHPCHECKDTPVFPREFQSISPAKKGALFADWVPPQDPWSRL
jgi:hypothetical protein